MPVPAVVLDDDAQFGCHKVNRYQATVHATRAVVVVDEQQLALLSSRKLSFEDSAAVSGLLYDAGYFRLSGYLRYFQVAPGAGNNVFRAGASFEAVRRVYLFDEELRRWLFDGLAIVEVVFRARFAYELGCRWNPDALQDRLEYVGYLYRSGRLIDVWCKDWRRTLDDVPEFYAHLIPSRVVAYLDPPYIDKSSKLYRQSFDPHGGYAPAPVDDLQWDDQLMHVRLAEYLRTRAQFRWILSYDAHPSLTTNPWFYCSPR